MSDYHVKNVTLSSGRSVEIVVFEGQPSQARETVEDADKRRRNTPGMCLCPACSSDLVQPVDWSEAGEGSWNISLRCPNCETVTKGVYGREPVERYDEALTRGAEGLRRTLRDVAMARFSDDIDRFVSALRGDHILPADF